MKSMKNVYWGKKFSILGDSISTLEGYNPPGYRVFYPHLEYKNMDVLKKEDTWWGKLIEYLGGELLVNNSWSGSRVTKLPAQDHLFPSGCSDERTSALHRDSIMPDVIIVYLGINDWANGVLCDWTENHLFISPEQSKLIVCEAFFQAYEEMLAKLKKNYPYSEIWCCSLCQTFISGNKEFTFPQSIAGTSIDLYNDMIVDLAGEFGCKMMNIDLFDIPYDSYDGIHPTKEGMNTLAQLMIRKIENEAGVKTENFSEDEQINTKINEKYQIIAGLEENDYLNKYLAFEVDTHEMFEIEFYDKTKDKFSSYIYQNVMKQYFMRSNLRHPGIQEIREIIENEKYIYVVKEYVKGRNLNDFVTYGGMRRSPELVIHCGKKICKVLQYIHTLNPPHIHRDIKPENIVLLSDGNIKLIDFGIMRQYDSRKKADTCMLGTRGYAAPEQYSGTSQSDARTDIYGVGMTMFSLITGADPGKEPEKLRLVYQINPFWPKNLQDIISKCIELDPRKRYQTAGELLRALNGESEKKLWQKIFGRDNKSRGKR